MKNTSKENLMMQYKTILESIHMEVDFAMGWKEDVDQLYCEALIEQLEGIKEIQVALKTLTN